VVRGGPRTLSNTPDVFTALDYAAIGGLDIFRRANDREGDRIGQDTGMVCIFIISLDRRRVDSNALCRNNFANLRGNIESKLF
jgi:hypothetical protein